MAAIELYSTPLFSDASLVSYWRMEDATDSKGSNNGAVYNATNGACKFNNGYIFDGTGDYIRVENSASLNLGNSHDLTVTAWLYVTTAKDYAGVFAKVNNDAQDTQSYLFTHMADSKLQGNNGGAWIGKSAGSVATGGWHHVAFVVSGGRLYYYIDGSLDANNYAFSYTDRSTDEVLLGKWAVNDALGYDLNGKLDDVALFSRALTATEISNLYTGNWTNIKSVDGIAKASVKSINGLAIASVKSIDGIS